MSEPRGRILIVVDGRYPSTGGAEMQARLLARSFAGAGCGALQPFRGRRSLQDIIPRLQRRLAEYTLLGYLLFTIVVVYQMATTSFRLG